MKPLIFLLSVLALSACDSSSPLPLGGTSSGGLPALNGCPTIDGQWVSQEGQTLSIAQTKVSDNCISYSIEGSESFMACLGEETVEKPPSSPVISFRAGCGGGMKLSTLSIVQEGQNPPVVTKTTYQPYPYGSSVQLQVVTEVITAEDEGWTTIEYQPAGTN
jgi:hypothetical protein